MLVTESLPPLEPHQQRAVDEWTELDRRCGALERMLFSAVDSFLIDGREYALLSAQLAAMNAYRSTLLVRINLWRNRAKIGQPLNFDAPADARQPAVPAA